MPMLDIALPAGTLTSEVRRFLTERHIAVTADDAGVTMDAGSPAARMAPEQLAKLLHLGLITVAGTVEKVGYVAEDIAPLLAGGGPGTSQIDAMLATGWPKENITGLIDAAAKLAAGRVPEHGDKIVANATAWKAKVAATDHKQGDDLPSHLAAKVPPDAAPAIAVSRVPETVVTAPGLASISLVGSGFAEPSLNEARVRSIVREEIAAALKAKGF